MKKGSPWLRAGVEHHEVPFELEAIGTTTTHRERMAPGSVDGCLHVVGVQAERAGPSPMSTGRRCSQDPIGSGLVSVDEKP
jgi:hypothetical protein